MEKRKQYSEEFKKRAVKMSHDPNRSVQSITQELGISRTNLYKWRMKYDDQGEFTEEYSQGYAMTLSRIWGVQIDDLGCIAYSNRIF